MSVGTTDNVAGSTTGNVTSGTASEAMIKAAPAASSPDSTGTPGATGTGDTTKPGGTGTAPTTTGATGQPGSTSGQPTATGTRGEAPESRIEAAVKNARAEYAWTQELIAQGYKPEDVKEAVRLFGMLRKDSKAFHAQLGKELGATTETPDPEEQYPEADLNSQDGKAKAFSDKAMMQALDVHGRKLLKQWKTEIAPLLEFQQSEMSNRQHAQLESKARAMGDAALKHISTYPHFEAHKKAIGEKLNATSPEVLEQFGPIGALFMAYQAVVQEKVLPTLESDTEKRIREEFAKKAGTSGSVHPSGAGGDVKKVELRGVDDLSKHMERLAAQGVGAS